MLYKVPSLLVVGTLLKSLLGTDSTFVPDSPFQYTEGCGYIVHTVITVGDAAEVMVFRLRL